MAKINTPRIERNPEINKKYILIILAFILILCFVLRVALPWNLVFTDNGIKLLEVDPYYQMRMVDWLTHNNMASLSQYDPYALYPNPTGMRGNDLFNRLIAGLAIAFGLGNPSDNLINTVAVFIPPILAVLATLVIFFIGKTLFNPTLGLIASGLYAIIPGESMGRALLGMVDQHIFEVLLTCMIILFFILAIKNEQRLKQGVIWATATGFTLWLYFWNWSGAFMFAFIICLYLIVQSTISRIKKVQNNKPLIIGAIILAIPTILMALKIGFHPDATSMTLMPLSLLAFALLFALSYLPRKINIAYYLLILVSPIIIILTLHYSIVLYFTENLKAVSGIWLPIYTTTLKAVNVLVQITLLSKIFGHDVITTTAEAMPLLYWRGQFSLLPAWGNFGFCFPLFFVGLGFILRKAIKEQDKHILFVAIWSIVLLALTLAMRRFAYYFAVNVALLSAFALWMLWGIVPKDAWKRTLIILILIVAIILPLAPSIKNEMSQPSPSTMTTAWQEAMVWLKDNTVEPFSDKTEDGTTATVIDGQWFITRRLETISALNYYYADYDKVGILEPDYTVLSWWDYGYWIMREGRRVPICNPGGGASYLSAGFFTATDTEKAGAMLQEGKVRYIIIDYSSAINKFYAMPAIAITNVTVSDYFDVYLVPQQDNTLVTRPFYYPAYYQSMIARLYNFNGGKVDSPGTMSLQYDKDNRVISLGDFPSLEEAENYTQSHEGNFVVGGTDPFVSPVDLEPLEGYKLAFQSKVRTMGQPSVKIFEVTTEIK